LGQGSNVLVSDAGVRGVVIKVGKGVDRVRFAGAQVAVQAGHGLPRLAQAAARRGLAGLEFAAGIPASVGGAVVMNAGAHGHAMSEVVERVRVVTPRGEEVLAAAELGYAYRTSVLQHRPAVVLEADLRLVPAPAAEVQRRMDAWLAGQTNRAEGVSSRGRGAFHAPGARRQDEYADDASQPSQARAQPVDAPRRRVKPCLGLWSCYTICPRRPNAVCTGT
ncbi:MAG: FAD-binding protein, partial [Pirellulales bacterium]|nr:FAD-binding protein [Pirellulales bacterium]